MFFSYRQNFSAFFFKKPAFFLDFNKIRHQIKGRNRQKP